MYYGGQDIAPLTDLSKGHGTSEGRQSSRVQERSCLFELEDDVSMSHGLRKVALWFVAVDSLAGRLPWSCSTQHGRRGLRLPVEHKYEQSVQMKGFGLDVPEGHVRRTAYATTLKNHMLVIPNLEPWCRGYPLYETVRMSIKEDSTALEKESVDAGLAGLESRKESAAQAIETEEKMEEHEATDGNNSDDKSEYPQGMKFILLTVALMLAIFIMALDTTIICKSVGLVNNSNELTAY